MENPLFYWFRVSILWTLTPAPVVQLTSLRVPILEDGKCQTIQRAVFHFVPEGESTGYHEQQLMSLSLLLFFLPFTSLAHASNFYLTISLHVMFLTI
jgi:hypothetical protein